VSVDGFVAAHVAIDMQPCRAITGIVLWDRSVKSPSSASPAIGLVRKDPRASSWEPIATLATDGTLTFSSVVPGRYTLKTNTGVIKSAILNGQDIMDEPLVVGGDRDLAGLVVTLTDRTNPLTGTVLGAAGAPVVDTDVLLFAADRRYWTFDSRRVLVTQPDSGGRYRFAHVPAGDYLVVAADIDEGSQFDPDVLMKLSGRAERVTITEGVPATRNLRR